MFAVKVITVLVLLVKVCRVVSSPQLNLPPLPTVPTTRPDIYHNSYTPNKFSDRDFSFDSDRSQRFGPPYSDQEDDRVNDFRQGKNNGDRDQNGYFYRDRPPYNSTNSFERDRFQDYPRNDDRYRNQQDRRYSVELERIRQFLTETDHKGSLECTANVIAQWTFETDVNEITQGEALLSQQRFADYQHFIYDEIKRIDTSAIFDQDLYRQLILLSNVGPSALPPDQLDRFHRLINDMLAIYNTATICKYQQPFQCGLRLQVELKEIMARSRDWDELQHVWTEWRRKTGFPMRDLYEQLIDLVNDVAVTNNFTNGGEYWFSPYESSNFREDVESVWQQVLPLYELIHAYVRRKLREYYGPDKINRNAPIPAHILGNMYGQSWTNILDIIIPYPGKSFIDVTPRMLEQGYTPLIMFQLADEFFQSMNMTGLSPEFWVNSIIEQPVDRPVICQPSAWDFCNRRDFRVKMCTNVNHRDLVTVHHEMAHVQYFLNYRHQPKVFRDGANPGFHEAIGDAIGLSVSTPKHLQTLGLIQKSLEDSTYDINFLFAMAVDKVVFLPFALAVEAWRYDVFSRRSSKEMLNCHYWDLREQFGGIKPPVLRSEKDFDPGAKYHIPANIPYMKTILFLESEDDPILGNGTNIFWTKIAVCCDGYKTSDHDPSECVPDCGDKCEYGTCLAPNKCICFQNYVKSADNDCVPTCPHSCLNGHCRSSGCKCNAGYELDKATKSFCRPTCSLGCKELQYCSEPGSCQCKPGYAFNKDGSCVFKCDTRCGYGDCIGPNKCRCHLGYILRDGRCQAECYQRCENGSCISKDLCTCNFGYEYDVHTTSCLPKCDGCTHGVCISKNFCKCFKGYKWIQNSCRPCNGLYGHW